MGKNRKTERIEYRMTLEEKQQLQNMLANSIDVSSLSELIRKLLFEQESPIAMKVVHYADPELIKQIRVIRININQLTHRVNRLSQQGEKFAAAELQQMLDYIAQCLEKLLLENVE